MLRFTSRCSTRSRGWRSDPFDDGSTATRLGTEEATPWFRYQARSCYLLQQGHFAADIAYFYGEDSNLTALFGKKGPEMPNGFNFDYFNADALIHKLSLIDGLLGTESGMRYRVLALDPQSAHVSAGLAQDSRSGASRCDRSGTKTYRHAQPQ